MAPVTNRATQQLLWLGLLLGILYLVFGQIYSEFFRPYFPKHWDQVGYLRELYTAYFAIIDTKSLAGGIEALTAHIFGFKGPIVGSLSLSGMLIFGPDRLVPVSVNFVALAYLAFVAVSSLDTDETPYLGSIVFGFVLLSNGLYIPQGGLFDARYDFPGLCAFGGFVIALISFDRTPSRRRAAIVICTALISLLTRSITGVYLVGTLAAYAASMGFLSLVGAKNGRFKPATALTLVAAVMVAAYTLTYWKEINFYYLGHLKTGEVEYRLGEYGLSSRFDLPLFYLRSAWDHLSILLSCAGALSIAGIIAGLGARRRLTAAATSTPGIRPSGALIVCACSVAAILVPLSTFSPSQVVAGVLTGPVAAACGVLTLEVWRNFKPSVGLSLARGAIALGALCFVAKVAIGTPPYMAELASSRAHNEFYARLSKDLPPSGAKISWFALTEGLNGYAFQIYLYENRLADQAATLNNFDQPPFTRPLQALDRAIESADAIVIWSRFPAHKTYDSVEILRETESDWRPRLEQRFVAHFEVSRGLPGVVTYYRRNPRILSRPEPVEWVRFGEQSPIPFVWLTEPGSQLAVENVLDHPVRVVLNARVVPGPSFKDRSRRTLRVETPQQSYEIEASDATQWRVSLPLTIPAGVSRLQMKAVLPSAERVAVPNDPRTLIAGVWDLRLD